MIYRTSKSEIDKYRENPALSQSDLKKLLLGLDAFTKEEPESETLPMIIGSAVDTILTGQKGDFEKEFYISTVTKPSDTMEAMLVAIYNNAPDKNLGLDDLKDLVEEVVTDFNYQPNWKIETRISKVVENFGYYEELKASAGKTVISLDTMTIIDNVVNSLQTNPVTASLFSTTERTNIDFYYQLPIFWEYMGVNCKGLIDLVIVEKDMEGLVRSVTPYDLKTMGESTLKFIDSVKKRRYDIQAAWYTYGLLNCKELPFSSTNNLKPFKFIVESTTNPGRPIIYECSEEILKCGFTGIPELIIEGRVIRKNIIGFNQLMELYLYYEKEGWREEKSILESNGRMILNWDTVGYYKDTENGDKIWQEI